MTVLARTGVAAPPSGVPTFAWRPVLTLACGLALVLGVSAHWYGYFGDELYFIVAGHHPSWGYADQPAILPLLAAGLDDLAPGSTTVLRLPAVLAIAGIVVLAALIARELGGRPRAQLTAAGAVSISVFLLSTGRLLATSTLDPLAWSILLWLVVRWVRTDHDGHPDDRLLLVAGAVLGVVLNMKFLVLGLVAGLAVGVLLIGPRRLLTRPLLWVGLVIAMLAAVPTLHWQALHGWPQLQMGDVVAGEGAVVGNRWQFLPIALVYAGLVPGVVLLLVGLTALLRRPTLAPWRFLGVTVLVVTAAFVVAGGRPYYVTGFYALLFAAGAVALQDQRARRWWRWMTAPATFAVCGVLTAVLVLPVGPASPLRDQLDFTTMGQLGWPALAAGVARQVQALPPGQRGVVIAGHYWLAGAMEHDRVADGLPPVFSPHRGYGYLAVPPGQEPALLVGTVAKAASACAELRPLPAYVPPVPTPISGAVPLALCLPRAPWSTLWPELRTM